MPATTITAPSPISSLPSSAIVAEDIGIKAGDFIVAIDDHYLFTIQELDTELRSHPYGSRVDIRYRRNSLIYDNLITLGPATPKP